MGKFSKPRHPFNEDDDLTQIIPPIKDSDQTQIIPPLEDLDQTKVIPHAEDPDQTKVIPTLDQEDMTQIFKPINTAQPTQVIPSIDDDDMVETISASLEQMDEFDEADIPPVPRAPRSPAPKNQPVHRSETASAPPEEPDGSRKPMDKNKKIMLISICAAAILALAGIIWGVVALLGGDNGNGRILNNVTAAGVNIGGMTKEEAKTALHRATDLTYSYEDMVIELPDGTIRLTPASTGVKLDIDAVVEEAYNYGRTGTKAENAKAKADSLMGNHSIALLPYLNLNLDYIRSTLDEYGTTFNSTFQQSEAKVEGKVPELKAADEDFKPDAPCQTLILTVGRPGRNLSIDKLYNQVLDAYSFNTFHVTAKMTDEEVLPENIDLEALHKQYCTEPQNAVMDMKSFEVTHEVYGHGFDLEAAQKQLDESKYGDVLEIPFALIKPEVVAEDLEKMLFRDELASYKTAHTKDANRNTNLTLACKAINGKVLNPGEEFDYNKVVGRRTQAAGYKPAGAYSNGELVSEIGGGICQVSSTLYYCAMVADLEITSRTPHSHPVSYMPLGMDATVSWGGPEFKFRNNTNYPIRIEAEVSGGYVQIKLIGTDEKEYYIDMEYEVTETVEPDTITETMAPNNPKGYTDGQVIQEPSTGYTVKTYRCKYSKETKKRISRDLEATSVYKKRDKIVVSILQPTEPPTVETEDDD